MKQVYKSISGINNKNCKVSKTTLKAIEKK
jgi:hypothetical protein